MARSTASEFDAFEHVRNKRFLSDTDVTGKCQMTVARDRESSSESYDAYKLNWSSDVSRETNSFPIDSTASDGAFNVGCLCICFLNVNFLFVFPALSPEIRACPDGLFF